MSADSARIEPCPLCGATDKTAPCRPSPIVPSDRIAQLTAELADTGPEELDTAIYALDGTE